MADAPWLGKAITQFQVPTTQTPAGGASADAVSAFEAERAKQTTSLTPMPGAEAPPVAGALVGGLMPGMINSVAANKAASPFTSGPYDARLYAVINDPKVQPLLNADYTAATAV